MTTLIRNKAFTHSYEAMETLEAGIVLYGAEVKSLKNNHAHLKGAYVSLHPDNTLWLHEMYITPYKPAKGHIDYAPDRPRKLLVNKSQIAYLGQKLREKGLTIVPVTLYTKGTLIKVEIVIARGLKKHDKRQKLKQRTITRDIQRAIKRL